MSFLERFERLFCSLALLVTALVLFINVALRYLFNSSTSWAEELIRYLMVWITFIGTSLCVRQSAHIRMDFLLGRFSERTKRAVGRVVFGLSALFCLALTWYGVRLTAFSYRMGQTSPALGIPIWAVYLCVPVGSFMAAWQFARLALGLREDRA